MSDVSYMDRAPKSAVVGDSLLAGTGSGRICGLTEGRDNGGPGPDGNPRTRRLIGVLASKARHVAGSDECRSVRSANTMALTPRNLG